MKFISLFGNNKKKVEKTPNKVIEDMKKTLSLLNKRESHTESQICKYKKEAKLLIKTDKKKALSLLRKCKIHEKQLNNIYGQKLKIENQILAIEQGINNKDVIESIKKGKHTLENMYKNIDVDDVGELMDDVASLFDKNDEISNALSMNIDESYDEDTLLEEFEEEERNKQLILEEDEKDKILKELPTIKETGLTKQEENELNELMTL